jgi:hypothetical protein
MIAVHDNAGIIDLPVSSYIGTRQEFGLGFNGVGINASSTNVDYIEQYGNDTGQGFLYGKTTGNVTTANNYDPYEMGGNFHIDNSARNTRGCYIVGSNTVKTQYWSMSIGFEMTNISSTTFQMICAANTAAFYFYVYGAESRFRWYTGGATYYFPNGSFQYGKKYIAVLSNNPSGGSTGGRGTIYRDGGSTYTAATTAGTSSTTTGSRIGVSSYGSYNANYNCNIKFGHFVWWENYALGSTQRTEVINKYRYKYRI